MTLKSPQSDLPRSLSGAADLWDVEQAGVLLTAEFFQDITQVVLSGANVAQGNTATTGAVTQTHILVGSSVSQQTTSTSGSVSQTHVLSAASASQANSSTSGAITTNAVTVNLSGVSVSSVAVSTVGGIVQTHILLGENSIQVNTSNPAGTKPCPGYLFAQSAKKCELQTSTILKNSLVAYSSKLATLTTEVINHV